jgi:hypothetical protein
MVKLFGVGCIVVEAFTIGVHSVCADYFLAFLRNNKINEFSRIFLTRGGARRLTKGMIRIDQKGIPPKNNF